jgi:hypothetical protein
LARRAFSTDARIVVCKTPSDYRGTEKFVEFRKMEISHPKIFNFPISRLKLAKLVPGDRHLSADFKDTDLSICVIEMPRNGKENSCGD